MKLLPWQRFLVGLATCAVSGFVVWFLSDWLFSDQPPKMPSRLVFIFLLLLSSAGALWGCYLMVVGSILEWREYCDRKDSQVFKTISIDAEPYVGSEVIVKCSECGLKTSEVVRSRRQEFRCKDCKTYCDVPKGREKRRWQSEVEFDCPECGEPLRASRLSVGKTAECAVCERMIRVPKRATPGEQPIDEDGRQAAPETLRVIALVFSAASLPLAAMPCVYWLAPLVSTIGLILSAYTVYSYRTSKLMIACMVLSGLGFVAGMLVVSIVLNELMHPRPPWANP